MQQKPVAFKATGFPFLLQDSRKLPACMFRCKRTQADMPLEAATAELPVIADENSRGLRFVS
jgi:hypothetical protein